MSAHTPGPWFVRHCDDERFMCMTVISSKDYGEHNNSQFDGEPDTIAITYHQCHPFVCGGFEIDEIDERDANARIIAAAPDLLDALLMARKIGDGVSRGFLSKFYAVADTAIAKATGETP